MEKCPDLAGKCSGLTLTRNHIQDPIGFKEN